jgi:hypothetical protein
MEQKQTPINSIPELGTLEQVDLRLAWAHEAHQFTPWLALHLDQLAAQLGIPLELEGSEVSVNTFAADILARNPQDNSRVLIENQLERSDHSHLGQIMTYLAGLEADVVVWIAADFREAHLSAVQWLNEHTAESFAFFAVKVRVVRIGSSPLAPIFEVVARPNAWERRLQAVNQVVKSASPQMQFRREFWEYYASRYLKIAQDVVSGANSNRWREVKELGIAISSYLGKDGVGIYVRSNSGAADSATAVYHTLLPFADILSQRLGTELGDPDGKYFFSATFKADTADRSRWADLTDWLYEKTETYEQALRTLGE